MNKQQFNTLVSRGYTHIPLVREVVADLETPLSVYFKLADAPYSYLFESVQGGEKWGRYSFIGLPCSQVIKIYGHTIQIEKDGVPIQELEVEDPLTWIQAFQAKLKVPQFDELPRFAGGLVGYFGHDTVRYMEPCLGECPNPDRLGTPDILLMVSDELVVFDSLQGSLQLIVHADAGKESFEQAEARLQTLLEKLAIPLKRSQIGGGTKAVDENDFAFETSEQDFKKNVERAREYIINGDIMQVVLSQRSSVKFDAPPLNLYRALRTINPSPYMYYLNFDQFQVVGSSPEILVRLEDDKVTVRPIAGTRRRGHDEQEDMALEKELLADPKEIAEHLMLIDLGRNDVGRVSQTGSVQLTDKMIVERYSHVMHIVSNVEGKLRDGLNAMDVLRATFPAGTLSGAPKVRALEIIDELETVKRGVYGGAVGYISWSGNMDTAIAIRTALIQNKTLYMQAGAGIVYDSQPNLEWKETINKSRVVFRAAALAAKGLHRA
ncbi:MAG: anthranilate synthase component I [Gammaproteobacteria bacterium]|nr:anthranilate synthase component I [Gammaproteobacteria bacterium]